MEALQKFAKNPCQENYNELMEFAIEKICFIITEDSEQVQRKKISSRKGYKELLHLDEFKEKMNDFYYYRPASKEQFFLEVQGLAKKAFQEITELQEVNQGEANRL